MSFVIGTTTLPLLPFSVTEANPSTLKTGDLPNKLPMIVSIGRATRKVTLEGYIFVTGQSKSQLTTSYLTPLRNQTHTLVAVTSPDSRYNGNYILEDFTFTETSEYPGAFKYKILLSQGESGYMLVLS